MITVLNKKTNELIGFDDSTSSDEISSAMRGYNYGEISTHKPTFYERTFQPVLKTMGADMATPKFVFTRPEPDPVGIFTRSAVKEATFGLVGNKQQEAWDQQDSDKFIIAELGSLKLTPYTLGPVAGMTGSIGIASKIASLMRFPAVGAWASRLVGKSIVGGAESLGQAKIAAKTGELAGRVVGGAVEQAGTGAVFGGIRETVAQIDEEDPKWGNIGIAVLKDAGIFSIYGATGSGIQSKSIGTASIAGVAYGLAKAEGATEEDAIFSGAVMALFHGLSANGDTPEFRKKVVNSTEDLIWGYLKSKSPLIDRNVAGKTANEFKMIVAHEAMQDKKQDVSDEIHAVVKYSEQKKEPFNPIDEVISSKENTEAFVNKLAEKILDVESIKKDLKQDILEDPKTRAQEQQQLGAKETSSYGENITQKNKDVKLSKVFQRAKEKYKGLQDQADVQYDVKTLEDQIARAIELSDKEPARFKKIALGQMKAPEGMTDTAVNIVYAEKMLEAGNNAEAFRALRNHSLKQTERGQEIAMERARATNVNDAQAFMQQVIDARMQNIGKKLWEFSTKEKTGTARKATTEKIKREVETVKKEIDSKQLDIEEAQKLIDQLRCK